MSKDNLEATEATGDCFFKLIKELGKPLLLESPYSMKEEEMEKAVTDIQNSMVPIFSSIRSLWASSFWFSKNLKHDSIVLSKGNTEATGKDVDDSMVLIEPNLSMVSPSRICFRVNKVYNALLGICYRNEVEKRKFTIEGNYCMNLASEGVYMLH